MRYGGNFIENIRNAAKSKDTELMRSLVLDAVSSMIENDQKIVIDSLRKSNVLIKDDITKENLINKVSYNIVNNPIFQKNIETSIADFLMKNPRFDNAEGVDGGGQGGGGNIVAELSGMVGSVFNYMGSRNELKAQEASSKATIYSKVFGSDSQKTNWLPIVAIAGVLLIGGLVVWRVTGKK